MRRNAPAYFALDFTEKRDETVIVVYLSNPLKGKESTGKWKREQENKWKDKVLDKLW